MFDYVKNVVRRLCGQTSVTFNKTPRIIEKSEHGINPKLVSWQAKKTCEALQKRGFKAFIVGGAVRDLLLGVAPKDFDVVTDATPEQVKRSQRRAIIIGRRFQIVHVLFGSEIIECSTFRALDAVGVRKDAEGRVVSDNVFGPMWQDAARRDFTINALYYDPVTEQVYDYHNGLKDLAQRRLRIIGSASERYREDPVRMMRATRIAGKLGLSIEPATKKPIIQMAELLRNVPAARLFDEMMKLFTCGKAEICLKEMRKNHLLHPLMPVLDVILSEPQGEEFLMLAMHRTDERIAIGKKISPSFLFATLLWPQVKKRWDAYQSRPRTTRVSALFQASEDVAATQCNGLLIQNRFIVDMKIIWMLQVRFERRTGKNPYTLISHPKYRAGYDFMLLRSQLGHVPEEQVHWWEAFVAADDATREAMVLSEEKAAGKTPAKSRRRTKVPKGAVSESEVAEALQTLESERKVRRPRKRQTPRKRADKGEVIAKVPEATEKTPQSGSRKSVREKRVVSES